MQCMRKKREDERKKKGSKIQEPDRQGKKERVIPSHLVLKPELLYITPAIVLNLNNHGKMLMSRVIQRWRKKKVLTFLYIKRAR